MFSVPFCLFAVYNLFNGRDFTLLHTEFHLFRWRFVFILESLLDGEAVLLLQRVFYSPLIGAVAFAWT